MSLNERIIQEFIQELRQINTNLKNVISEIQQNHIRMDEIRQHYRDDHNILRSIVNDLRDFQGVIDYQMTHTTPFDQEKVSTMKRLITNIGSVLDSDMTGISALNTIPITSDDTPIYTNSKSFLQYLAELTNLGTNTTSRLFYRIGLLVNVSTTSQQFLDEGYTTEPANVNANGLILRVFSSSTNDSAAGTGAQKVFISGIDTAGIRVNETVTMAGTTRVNTITTWKYLDFFCITQLGTYNGTTAGNISLTNTAETTTFASIPTGRRSWRSGRIHVPVNGRGYIHQWVFGSFKNDVSFELLVTPNTDKNTVIGRSATNTTGQSTNILFPAPIYIPSNGRTTVQAIAAGTVNQADTSFSVHMETI